MKLCSDCKEQKDTSCFYASKSTKDKLHPICKSCSVARLRAWGKKNPERLRAKIKECKQKQKERDPGYQMRSWRKCQYGLSESQYQGLLTEQNFKCAICSESLQVKGPQTSKPMIDHCHETQSVRGILCFYCNTALGKFRDSERILLSAIRYLRKHKTQKTS